jgi:hypothetical protein
VDGWWSASPGGPPTGRFQSVFWPNGIDAQTITASASGPLTQQVGASITIKRVDSQPFDLQAFTGKILGNTAGAGASFEIMPQLNGQDAFADPLMFDATGYAGSSFSHSPMLAGYDTYLINLWMDYALTQLTVVDPSLPPVLDIAALPPNQMRLTWPTNTSGYSLQQNSSLTPTNWTMVTNAVSVIGTNNQVTLPKQGAIDFLRLVMP